MKDRKILKGFFLGASSCFLGMVILVLVLEIAGIMNLSGVLAIGGTYSALEHKILNKVNVLEMFINEYFLDEIDEEKMADSVYKGVVNGLGDEYAAYYTAEEYQDIMEKTSGVYCGIGAYISVDADTGLVTIVSPMKNSPCEKAGIENGDIIFAVDGKEVTGVEISQVQALVKGVKGSEVVLTIIRGEKQMDITVIRDEIVEDTVNSRMLDDRIGYIQISGFEQVTPKQFESALEKLEKKGQRGLIIDLRDNGGGLLDSAVEMLDRMLPKGVVVYSKDKKGEKQEYMAEDDDSFDKPLVILVNEKSASASEVFCGAIQDEGKGKLLGTKTFGKGIVQGVFGLDDGSAIKMTIARYYTPKGRNIHGKGLKPDIEVELKDIVEKLPESGMEVDNQVKAAFDYLAGM